MRERLLRLRVIKILRKDHRPVLRIIKPRNTTTQKSKRAAHKIIISRHKLKRSEQSTLPNHCLTRHVVLDRTGHWGLVTRRDAFAREVTHFVETLP